MKNDILDKLKFEIAKDEIDEIKVIYYLSRIRKILEIDKNVKAYKVLKFYCDWALHSHIDNTQLVSSVLREVFFGGNIIDLSNFSNFSDFDSELKSFFKEYAIESSLYSNSSNLRKFHDVLWQIYTDTPLIFREIKKYMIIPKRENENNLSFYRTEIKEGE